MTGDNPSAGLQMPQAALIDRIPGGVIQCLADPALTIISVNQGFLSLCGYSDEEIQRDFFSSFYALVHQNSRDAVLRAFQRLSHLETHPMDLEHQLLCKSGTIWVLNQFRAEQDADGRKTLYCLVLDVTHYRRIRDELRMSLERHRIIMDQTTDILFEWDMQSDRAVYSINWEKKFGYTPIREDLSKKLMGHTHIHPDDAGMFEKFMDWVGRGNPYFTSEIRIQDVNDQYFWCRFRITVQFDKEQKPVRAVGVIVDVTEEHTMIEGLRHRAERDALTGLYNKAESQSMITSYLRQQPPGEICALLMIDIDNFKQINDTKGHLYGDVLLTELAACMKSKVRSADIIGRIGGDEFVIFLKRIPSGIFSRQKAQSLLNAFHELFAGQKQGVPVSCSIGIALSPFHGRDFQWLYQCADSALYQAKTRGKDQVVLYDTQSGMASPNEHPSSLGAEIDSDRGVSGVTYDLVNYVFHILYSTTDLEEAAGLILEIVGKRFDVSRAYIFENSADGRFMSNTFEWCNVGVTSEKDSLQNLAYADMPHYEDSFDENGIFYCHDIANLPEPQRNLVKRQGIYSMLQCAIYEEGRSRGFVGFDECTGLRMWTQEEVAILTLISKLLSTFLLKKRAQDRDKIRNKKMRTILDCVDEMIYVVDRQTYQILYLNPPTLKLAANATVGTRCYQAFYDRAAPCVPCPMKDAGTGKRLEFYNPRYDVWVTATSAPLVWDGRCACLITAHDITCYKCPKAALPGLGV